MRFHVPSLPHTHTTKEWGWCAYTQKVRKFADMMTSLGHEVFLYAGEDNEAQVTEHVPVVSKAEQAEWFGHLNWEKDLFPAGGWEPTNVWWQVMNSRTIAEIAKRKQPGDIIGVIMGRAQQPISDAHPDLQVCEWGIGYEGTFAPHRVFESYCWMHHIHGRQKDAIGRNYDRVIANSFELEDFPLGDGDGGYFMYLGRLIQNKGPHIAAEVTKRTGDRLVVAGQGALRIEGDRIYGLDNLVMEAPNMEYVGVLGPEERARLLGGARALFVPTIYIEPFGGVAVEAMLCGTPVISSDWGAFTETVVPGVTGFRCRTLKEYMDASEQVKDLDRAAVRENALKYTTDHIRHEYEYYFKQLQTLRHEGWYSLEDL